MKKKAVLALILAGTFVITTLASCAPQAPQVNQPPVQEMPPAAAAEAADPAPIADEMPALGRGVVVATQNDPPSIAPGRHNATAAGFMNSMNYNGLFRTDAETLLAVPDLVASWRAVSDTVFEFMIYEGIMFHNGEIMTAHDVIASFDYVRNYPDNTPNRGSIVRYEVIDDLTIRIDTDEPNAMLFVDLVHVSNMVMPRSLIESGHDFQAQAIGSGPFVFEEWRTGDSLHHTAFENYFDQERAARIAYTIWRVIPEGASRTIALETGEVDYIVEVASPDIARLEAHPDIEVMISPGTTHNKLLMNNEIPQFSDYRVRRAIAMAIDMDAVLIAGMDGFAIPTNAQVPTIFIGAHEEGTYEYDPEGAVAILAELGLDPATLAFNIVASNEERRRMGEVLQANLADIGIPVTIEMNDLATTLERQFDGNYEASFGGSGFSSLLGYVHGILFSESIGGPNRSRFRNDEIDDLIREALVTVDANARIPIYEQITRIANENTPHIPTHMSLVVRAFNANLVVPELPATGAVQMNVMYWSE
ncbi:MAG: ABC transporter substrate-binding protein [Defluviitaleaceae bacterium]|nr:ABC transporter substrate-binding protein [Defluviitaleaceae bacterium]